MAVQSSEAIILRTYPLREADVIVSYLARDAGKLRGVARGARKPKNRFGAGLQRLSYVRMLYYHRENRELDTLDSCELIRSPLTGEVDYEMTVVLDFIAEASEHLLPPLEANERFFRLLLAVTDHLRINGRAALWPAQVYYSLWAVKLGGFLPPLELPEEDRAVAEEMLRTPVSGLGERDWTRQTAKILRRALVGLIEEHIERKLVTAQYLEAI